MIIRSVHIIKFGMLSDVSLSFSEGLNVIEGNNETGKSTVGMFIKFIFYGLSKPEREKYITWGQQGCSGSLTLIRDGVKYRIERELLILRVKDKVEVYSESGAPIKLDKPVCDEFIGVPEVMFENSAFTGQIGTALNGQSLPEAIENILFSADEVTSTRKAIKSLDDRRVVLLHKNKKGGLINDLRNEISDSEVKLQNAKGAAENIFTLEDKIKTARARRESNKLEYELISARLDEYEAYQQLKTYADYEETRKKHERLSSSLKALEARYTINGFLPDGDYLDGLRTLEAQASELSIASSRAETELAKAERDFSDARTGSLTYEKIKLVGGAEKILETCTSLKKAFTSRKKTALLFLFTAVLPLLAGLYFAAAEQTVPAVICAGVFVLLVIVCGVLFAQAFKKRGQLKKILGTFDMQTVEALEEHFTEVEAKEASAIAGKEGVSKAEKALADAKAACAALDGRIGEFTGKYRKTDISGLPAEIAAAETGKNALDAARSELEICGVKLDVLAEKASGIVIADVKSRLKGKLRSDEYESFNNEENRKSLNILRGANDSLQEKITSFEKDLSAASATFTYPSSIYNKQLELRDRLSAAEAEYNALVMASESLAEASRLLRQSISPTLAANAGAYMSGFSGGKYDSLGVSDDLSVSYSADGMTHAVDTMSAGTQDIAYISLRLALSKMLFRHGAPVFFDDSFARVDSERLVNIITTLDGICKSGRQMIIFTCHGREGLVVSKLGGRVMHI